MLDGTHLEQGMFNRHTRMLYVVGKILTTEIVIETKKPKKTEVSKSLIFPLLKATANVFLYFL